MCKQRRSSVSRSIRFNVARPSNIIIASNHMRSESIVMYRCIWHEDRERKRTHAQRHSLCVCIHFINIFPNQLHLIYFPTFNIHISLWIFRTSLGFCFINHIFFCPNVFMFCLFVCFSPLHWHIQRRKPEHKIENKDERRESSISFPDTFVTLQTIESEPGPSPFHNNCRSNSESFSTFPKAIC